MHQPDGKQRVKCVRAGRFDGNRLARRRSQAAQMLLAICLAACSGSADGLEPNSRAAPIAFPGAEGYGSHSAGGRGGRIIQVTTLADAGPGSLRACIDASGPRICVFRVGGIIRFTTVRPIIRNPYITIAGETAPGGGILLSHAGGRDAFTPLVIKKTHDVVVRHIRVRADKRGEQRESNSGFIIESSRNVILDHVSGSWAIDENVGGYAGNDNVTISNSIFAEGIPKHDKCALMASDPTGPQHFSFIRNLCAHNGDRNPDVNFPPKSCVEVINNLLYDAQSEFTEIWESYGGTPASVVNNYYKAGPSTEGRAPAVIRQLVGSTGAARIYLSGNSFDGVRVEQSPSIAGHLVSSPPCPLTITPVSADSAYQLVLQYSGAFPRDSVDRRIIGEARERTGHIVQGPGIMPDIANGTPYVDSDGDGMADSWERSHGLTVGVNDAWQDHDGNGWANIEEFLDFASRERIAGREVQ